MNTKDLVKFLKGFLLERLNQWTVPDNEFLQEKSEVSIDLDTSTLSWNNLSSSEVENYLQALSLSDNIKYDFWFRTPQTVTLTFSLVER